MKKFGIRTSGTEIELEQLIVDYINKKQDSIVYYEIGCAGCITLRAISDILKENCSGRWRADGIDLTKGSSLNWQEINSVFNKTNLHIYENGMSSINYLRNPNTRLLLWDNPREFSRSLAAKSLDIVLIDGNHNKENVIEDFISIEEKVVDGGLVLFHDFGPHEQGTDTQAGGGFIEVLDSCKELGLVGGMRPNWRFLKEIKGSRYQSGDGNSFGVFKKE